MEIAAREGPYREAPDVDAPLAPSLRFTWWVCGFFALPASLFALGSVWSLFVAPACSSQGEGLAGEAVLLLTLTGATTALGALGTRRAAVAIRRRVRVRSWLGKSTWTTLAALPLLVASLCVVATALSFDLKYLFLRCLDLGGIGAFN